jgi:hypothetical protein
VNHRRASQRTSSRLVCGSIQSHARGYWQPLGLNGLAMLKRLNTVLERLDRNAISYGAGPQFDLARLSSLVNALGLAGALVASPSRPWRCRRKNVTTPGTPRSRFRRDAVVSPTPTRRLRWATRTSTGGPRAHACFRPGKASSGHGLRARKSFFVPPGG